MNIEEIKALVQLFEGSSLSELNLQRDGTHLTLKRNAGGTPVMVTSAPVAAPTPTPAAPATQTEATPAAPPSFDGHAVTSPLVGTFYRRPSPEEPSYVDAGTQVKKGDTLCIVEAMKVMNEIKSDIAGTVRDVLVEDSAVVEYGQPLILIDPS